MLNSNNINANFANEDRATLRMLSALERGDIVSQRELASEIGIALGFTNKLIKRAIHKGLLKVCQAPAKRYVYYLTPKGFSEKSRLVAEYISSSMHFFRHVRNQSAKAYQEMRCLNQHRIALYGASEIAEIAIFTAKAEGVALITIIDETYFEDKFYDVSVSRSFEQAKEKNIDALLICRSEDPQNAYQLARGEFLDAQIYTPDFFHINRQDAHYSRGDDE
jgi:DNA-binding MarR family transcriptional regulator